MDKLAPIALSAYSRLDHLKQTVTALKNNTLAKKSLLYVFSDAPKQGDEDNVETVRRFIKTINGFKQTFIIERQENDRVANNRGGMAQLLDEFGRVLFLEEDVITAPGFLQYINDGLSFFRTDQRIFAIGAHTPNLMRFSQTQRDAYLSQRFHPWGFGIWKDRFEKVKKLPDFRLIKKNKSLIKTFNKYGNDLVPMVKKEASGLLNAFDIRSCYHMCLNNLYMVLPTKTLVTNTGLDGSGLHCNDNDIYQGDMLSDKLHFQFDDNISIDLQAVSEYKKFYDKPSFYFKLLRKMLKK